MPGLSKRIGCLMILSLQLACSSQPPSAATSREHYDPAYLNEAAMAALALGERSTAMILLERAAVLAPQNALVRDNLMALRRGGALRVAPAIPVQATLPAPAAVTVKSPSQTAQTSQTAPTRQKTQDSALPAMEIWPLN